MTELPQALHRIREDASWARACFQTWNTLQLAHGDPQCCAVMKDQRYADFFVISREGNFGLFILSLGKIFDKSGGAINLRYLENKLNKGGHVEAAKKLTKIRTEHCTTIKNIRSVRNKGIAHNDPTSIDEVLEAVCITPNQIEALIDALCGILNEVAAELSLQNLISGGERFTESVRSLLDILHRSRMPRTKTLEWPEVKQFFEKHGCVVSGTPEIRWYQESWDALHRANLTNTTNFEAFEVAQTVLKLRALCLLAMYLGIYQVAGEDTEFGGYFSGHNDCSSYLASLNVKIEDLWELARQTRMLETECASYRDDEDVDDEKLYEIAKNFVRRENDEIYRALYVYYGGPMGLFVSLLNSRVPSDKVISENNVFDSIQPQDGKGEIFEYVEKGMTGWSWD